MVKKSKLLAALDAHKGRDYEAEKRKKQVKAANKKQQEKKARKVQAEEDKENEQVTDTASQAPEGQIADEDFHDFSDDDVADGDLEDAIPHQRLTINNGPALLAARSRISLLRKHPTPDKAPFHLHNSLISTLPPAADSIPDAMDDLKREAEFYNIARQATLDARAKLKAEGIPFTRPSDYFAEMVKTEGHMDKVKDKVRREGAERKGREEARRQRDARKFGKQVQRVKEEERARAKRDTLDKIKDLKRKRKGNLGENVREDIDGDDDLFEKIDVEKAGTKDRSGRERGAGGGGGGPPNAKRQKKDAKFGFGGKKKYGKSGNAESSADLSGFSMARMKGKAKPKRLGKSRRASAR
ncbi:hypothetical protein DV736_g3480, partial [Chaetothyriales sp. CBS 134916]